VSKVLLYLLVEILKVLPNSEINLNSKIKTLFSFPLPTQPIPVILLAHPAPPASLYLLHCVSPLLPGNTFSLSEGTCHRTHRPSSSTSRTEPEHASRHQQPASRHPQPPPLNRKRRYVASSFISPLNDAPSTLQYSGNRCLHAEALMPAVTHLHRPDAPSPAL
jgi:hypothetical protein